MEHPTPGGIEARVRVAAPIAVAFVLASAGSAAWRVSDERWLHAGLLAAAAVAYLVVWLGMRRTQKADPWVPLLIALLTATSCVIAVLTAGAALGPAVLMALLPILGSLLVSPATGGWVAIAVCGSLAVAGFAPPLLQAEAHVLGQPTTLAAIGVLAVSSWAASAYYERARRSSEARYIALREEAERTAARFRAYAENARDVVAELAEDGTILYASPGHEPMLGRAAEELLGRADADEIVHPDDYPRVAAFFADIVAGGGEGGVSARYLRPDRSVRWLQLRGRAYCNSDGEGRVVLFARDETPEREAAEEREALITRLQEALDSIETLRGIVPICAECKKVRREDGAWEQVEAYVAAHSLADFSHGLCDDCLARHDT